MASAGHDLGDAAREVRDGDWTERGARLGYLARATLYAVIAVTSLQVAFGSGGRTQGSSGAMRTIAQEPFGAALLIVIGLGLAGYAVWRLVQVFTVDEDSAAKAAGKRAFALVRAVLYGTSSFYAFRLVTSSGGGGGGGSSQKTITAQLLELPVGQPLVVAVGLVIVGYAGRQVHRGVTTDFEDDFKWGEMSGTERRWVRRLGLAGHVARGVVFAMIGVFLVIAAVTYDPQKAIGLDGALAKLAQTAYGTWLLGLVALGLLAFAAYSLAQSRYRRIET